MLTLDHHPHVPENPLGAFMDNRIAKMLKEFRILHPTKEPFSIDANLNYYYN